MPAPLPTMPLPTPGTTVRSRRIRVPPALTRGTETLAASSVLEELPGELGVLLWRSVRNAVLWASTPPAKRAHLFEPSAGAVREAEIVEARPDAELLAPLSVMVRMLEAPGLLDERRVVNACRRIALWAEQRGALGTAVEFAQAAALTTPNVAPLAYAVGRVARRRAEYDRAESWLARAVIQARRAEDWRTYALAYSGLGNLNVQKGNFPLARRAHERALRTALRHNLRDLQGSAYHDLFATALESGTEADLNELASQALRAYGAGHPKLSRLGFDVAYRWILDGFFGDALRVARALAPHFVAAGDRALVTSMIARSAGGAGDLAEFEAARERIFELLGSGCAEDAKARVLLGLAHGAANLSLYEEARRHADEALRTATLRREGRIALEAESTLMSVSSQRADAPRPAPPSARYLADQFVAALAHGSHTALATA